MVSSAQIHNKKTYTKIVFLILLMVLSPRVFFRSDDLLATFEGFNATILAYGQVFTIFFL
jgi:hypothetical protein